MKKSSPLKTALLFGASAAVIGLSISTPASAQCVRTGNVYDCNAPDPDGVDDPDPGLTLNNPIGGNLIDGGNDRGVDLGDGATINNDGDINSDGDDAVRVGDNSTVNNGGNITSAGDDGLQVGSGSVVNNTGTIISTDDEAIEASGEDNVTVNNSGTIRAEDKGIEANENLRVINSGTIESITSEAVEADAGGLFLDNSGDIIALKDDAVDGDDNVTIINSGTITGGENDAIELNSGTITNSGSIISVSSDPNGSLVTPGGSPELDAAIDFDAGTKGNEDGMVINMEGGLIEGDIGIVASPGNVDSPDTNDGSQTIVNFGTITGRMGDAVLLGNGDDIFQQWQTGVTNGLVNGEAGDDTLIFGNNGMDALTLTTMEVTDPTKYQGFETIGFLGETLIILTGDSNQPFTQFGGELQIDGNLTDTLTVAGGSMLTISDMASINVEGDDAIDIDGDNVMITNNGLIRSNDDEAIEGSNRNGLTVINNGTIIADANGDKGIEAEENLTIVNNGRIESATSEAIEADAAGLNLTNNGDIISPKDDAVDGDDNVTIVNNGLIQGGENDAIELNSGTITNSGTIVSLSSDPEGSLTLDTGTPELDAAIDFDAGTPGNEDGTVINLAGGLIEGDIGIVASPGNVDSPAMNNGAQRVINNGTIRGRMGDAVLLGNGDDYFELQAQGVVDGMVRGGAGTDEALIGGVFNADFLSEFEIITFNGATINGARTIAGNVTLTGTNSFDLTTNNLFIFGDLTLAAGTVVNINPTVAVTELDFNVPIQVVAETGAFTNLGAQINVNDNDLLVDYDVAFGSILITPQAVNPGAGATDRNVDTFGAQLRDALLAGTLNPAFAATINALPNLAAFSAATNGLLPSLSTGLTREVFENANLASSFLDQRFAAEGNGAWAQAAYRSGDRDGNFATVSGYEADNLVFSLGADTAVTDGLVLGLAATYADIDIDETNGSQDSTEIEMFKIGGYFAANLDSMAYVNGEIAYVSADADTSRSSVAGAVSSSFDFDGIYLKGEAGVAYPVSDNFTLTPSVGINYFDAEFDPYSETGGLNLGVDRGAVQFSEVRGRLHGQGHSGNLLFSGNIGYAYDLENGRRPVRITGAGSNAFLITSDGTVGGRIEAGASVGFKLMDNGMVSISYSGEFADGVYDSHGGFIRARFGF